MATNKYNGKSREGYAVLFTIPDADNGVQRVSGFLNTRDASKNITAKYRKDLSTRKTDDARGSYVYEVDGTLITSTSYHDTPTNRLGGRLSAGQQILDALGFAQNPRENGPVISRTADAMVIPAAVWNSASKAQ